MKLQVFALLFVSVAIINCSETTQKQLDEQLRDAVMKGKVDCVKSLVAARASLGELDGFNRKLFNQEAYGDHVEVIQNLVALKVSLNFSRNEIPPLHFAAQKGQVDAIRALVALNVSKCAVRSRANSPWNVTPLYEAAECGHIDAVKLFFAMNAPLSGPFVNLAIYGVNNRLASTNLLINHGYCFEVSAVRNYVKDDFPILTVSRTMDDDLLNKLFGCVRDDKAKYALWEKLFTWKSLDGDNPVQPLFTAADFVALSKIVKRHPGLQELIQQYPKLGYLQDDNDEGLNQERTSLAGICGSEIRINA